MRPADKELTQAVRALRVLAPGVGGGFPGPSPSAPPPSPELPLTPRAQSVTGGTRPARITYRSCVVAEFPAPAEGIVLTHFLVSGDVDRSRAFYTHQRLLDRAPR